MVTCLDLVPTIRGNHIVPSEIIKFLKKSWIGVLNLLSGSGTNSIAVKAAKYKISIELSLSIKI